MAEAAIPTAAVRKAAYDAAIAAAPTEEEVAATRQAALAAHWQRVIANWAAATAEAHPMASQRTLQLNISSLAAETVDAWEAELGEKGYVITRTATTFNVALPEA